MPPFVSSYEFHRSLESPAEFLRRERRTVLVTTGLFLAFLGITLQLVDPAFFYPRLSHDPLWYYLKATTFVEHGTTSARIAVNVPPFAYVSMPGVLRAPFLLVLQDFDHVLRAIQLSNALMLAAVGLLHAYVLSWMLPGRWKWAAIPFSFGFILLSPRWLANVLHPLGEAPYALAASGALVLSIRIVCSDRPFRQLIPHIAAATLLFVIAFLVKYTALALLLYVGVLVRGRALAGRPTNRRHVIAGAIGLAGVTVLVLANLGTMFTRYVGEAAAWLVHADKSAILINLTGLAIPGQIVPNFAMALQGQPFVSLMNPRFGGSARDVIVLGAGALLTAIVGIGVWASRRRLLPETVYLLSTLPLLALIAPSTARYLMPYQPIIWIFFIAGVVRLRDALGPRRRLAPGLRLATIAAAGLIAVAFVGLRVARTVGTSTKDDSGVSLARTPEYVSDVAGTFRKLRVFLAELPPGRTLLISDEWGSVGRWTVIEGLRYYVPDERLPQMVQLRDVYLLEECGTPTRCVYLEEADRLARENILRHGDFSFELVFRERSRYAHVKLYRINPGADASTTQPPVSRPAT